MAITLQQVKEAIETLESQGLNPTILAIQGQIGSGSTVRITKLREQLRQDPVQSLEQNPNLVQSPNQEHVLVLGSKLEQTLDNDRLKALQKAHATIESLEKELAKHDETKAELKALKASEAAFEKWSLELDKEGDPERLAAKYTRLTSLHSNLLVAKDSLCRKIGLYCREMETLVNGELYPDTFDNFDLDVAKKYIQALMAEVGKTKQALAKAEVESLDEAIAELLEAREARTEALDLCQLINKESTSTNRRFIALKAHVSPETLAAVEAEVAEVERVEAEREAERNAFYTVA